MRWHCCGTLRDVPEHCRIKDTLWITLRLQNLPLEELPAPLRMLVHHSLKLIYSTKFIDSVSNALFQGVMRPQQLARTLRKVLEWHICGGRDGWRHFPPTVVLGQSHWNFTVR